MLQLSSSIELSVCGFLIANRPIWGHRKHANKGGDMVGWGSRYHFRTSIISSLCIKLDIDLHTVDEETLTIAEQYEKQIDKKSR